MEKRKAVVLLVLTIMVLSIIQTKPMVLAAHTGSPIDSGWASTSPVIDGNITTGEWASATVVNFTLQMRSRTDGSLNRTLNGRLYVENNWTYAFLAVQIFNDDYEAHDFNGHYKGLAMLFNNNNNGTLVFGDNGEGVTTYTASPFYSHNDLYYAGSYWDGDYYAGKTDDGALAWSHTNATQGAIGNWTFEMMIPLKGTDAGYDFNITSLPYTVGYKLWFQEPANGLDGVYPYDPTIPKSFDQTTNASTFGDMTFYPLYNLTMVATTGGTTNPAPGISQYPFKTVVSATATANPWYQFDHWELDSVNVGAANPYSVTMNQNHTLKAVFIPLYALTITTTTGGTTTPTPGTYIYPNGTLVNVTATANSGYAFGHWELDSVNVGAANPYQVTMNQNHTLKAVFLPLYNLTIVTTGGGSTTPAPGTYTYVSGTSVSVNATANSGYVFDHWELDGFNVGTGNPYSVLMNQNHVLNATFVAQLSVTISPADSTIPLGNSVLFTSNVTGGTPGYSYQWYLVPNPVTGATSPSWTFTPTSPGIYYVYLNVTDSKGRVAISNTARVVVPPPIVGGYSIPFETSTSMGPFACYGAFVAAFGAVISFVRHKKKRESPAA
ncbi:MAG: PKD domain-containing protein [Candidatus Bathyarchaeia archaeon]